MIHPFYIQLALLLSGIALIVYLTTRLKVHPFFALSLVSVLLGVGAHLPATEVLGIMKDGFGQVMKSLGFIIVLGTALGIMLERTGRTAAIAGFILRRVGARHAAFAMSITGFIVGMPIFCDSGFIVLSGLSNSLARKAGLAAASVSVCLATGLYAVHCLIPPHPGAAAAAGIIGVDFGRVLLFGIPIALPAMLVGYGWTVFAGRSAAFSEEIESVEAEAPTKHYNMLSSLLPLLVPIVLIGLKSFLVTPTQTSSFAQALTFVGDPSIALVIGIVLCFTGKGNRDRDTVSAMLREAVEKSGGILVIIGAGGAFGHVLAATKIGDHFSDVLPLQHLGILFPFLLTFLLKTAQGSSTVAILTAASLTFPLLPALGMDTENGKLLCVLAMGGGSMMISHANDAYFWVISRFGGVGMESMLKVYTVATVGMGLTTLLMVYLLSFIL
ncbi:MAG TPA: GntP family permease [Chryseolinea sp.]